MNKDAKTRFFEKVTPGINENSCWRWSGAKNSKGYGSFGLDGKSILAHRYSYMIHRGEIPKGLFVCHTCDVPSCVNPRHLFIGDAKDNAVDMVNKGRQKQSPDHCPAGHLFTKENTRYHHPARRDKRPVRVCNTCYAERVKADTRKRSGTRTTYNRDYQRKYYAEKLSKAARNRDTKSGSTSI